MKSLLILGLFFILNIYSLPIKQKRCRLNYENKLNLNQKMGKTVVNKLEYNNILIDIRFVVIHNNNEGKVNEKIIDKQMNILNKAFGGEMENSRMNDSKIRFRKSIVKYINNNNFYKNCQNLEDILTRKLSKRTDKMINVIICKTDNYLGWTYLPGSFVQANNKMYSIFLNTETLPDGDIDFYNEGMTLVHEVGHFLGLLHTFNENNKCEDGDYIEDTPVEKYASDTCNYSRDTCPKHPGKDPIDNFMNYSPDYCLTRFSDGQIERMWRILNTYKKTMMDYSRDNYLKKFINEREYVKVGKGLCMNDEKKKLETYGYLKKGKFISKNECKNKTKKYLGQAFTFTYKKDIHNNNLKYNCLIHFVNNMDDIDDIINVEDINKNRYQKSECYKLI